MHTLVKGMISLVFKIQYALFLISFIFNKLYFYYTSEWNQSALKGEEKQRLKITIQRNKMKPYKRREI